MYEIAIESMLGHLRAMIRIPSVTDSPGEREAAAYLATLLEAAGVAHEIIEPAPGKPNLYARLSAPRAELPPVVLISHVDVAPVEGQEWHFPPFGGEVADGVLRGRGAIDTKHLTLMELYAFLHLLPHRKRLRRDVVFLATVDEERGSAHGMAAVADALPELRGPSVVINEGGGFPLRVNGKDYTTLTVGEKGSCAIRLRAKGQAGHASAPHDDQAMRKLCAAMEALLAHEAELPRGACRIGRAMRDALGTDQLDNRTAEDLLYYAEHSGFTIRDTRLGERGNVIVPSLELTVELRMLPDTTRAQVEDFLRRVLAEQDVQAEIQRFEPGFACDFDDPAVRDMAARLEAASARNGFDCRILPMMALGRTDGRFFGTSGARVFGCSPVLLSDGFDRIMPTVHGPDERISVDSFTYGCRVLRDIVQEICLGGEAT